MISKKGRTRVGWACFLAGSTALAVAVALGEPPNWTWWGLFTVVAALLSFSSVEINDRLLTSSSVMAMLTGGIVFSLQSGSAILGMTLLAALTPLAPEDLRARRFFQPAFNFGQLTISALAAGLVLDAILAGVGRQGPAGVGGVVLLPGDFFQVAVAGSVAALVFTLVNATLVGWGARWVYGASQLLPWSGMPQIVGGEMLMGLMGGLLGGVLVEIGVSALPLILTVYVIGHLAYGSYSQLRTVQEASLRGFSKTLETRDVYTRGHTDRVAYFSRLIGEELGLTAIQHEHLRFAALIHDVGLLAVSAPIIQKEGDLTDDEYRQLRVATHRVDDLLAGVDFLRPMVEIASGIHPRLPGENFGQKSHSHSLSPSIEQRVLAVADAFDGMTNNRTYRMALGQEAALASLGREGGALYDPSVINALGKGLERVGQRYGPNEIEHPPNARPTLRHA